MQKRRSGNHTAVELEPSDIKSAADVGTIAAFAMKAGATCERKNQRFYFIMFPGCAVDSPYTQSGLRAALLRYALRKYEGSAVTVLIGNRKEEPRLAVTGVYLTGKQSAAELQTPGNQTLRQMISNPKLAAAKERPKITIRASETTFKPFSDSPLRHDHAMARAKRTSRKSLPLLDIRMHKIINIYANK